MYWKEVFVTFYHIPQFEPIAKQILSRATLRQKK